MKAIVWTIAEILLILAASPWPDDSGIHALNNRLTGLQNASLGNERGPEHIAWGRAANSTPP